MIEPMTADQNLDDMRSRLEELLEKRDVSMRAASLNAKLAKGYLHSVLKEGREPTVANIAKICAANDFSLAYVLLGFEMSPATERLIGLIEQSPDRRDAVLSLLGSGGAAQTDQ